MSSRAIGAPVRVSIRTSVGGRRKTVATVGAGGVERDREIRPQLGQFPGRHLPHGGKVDDGDLPGVGDVDKGAPGGGVDRKGFGMCREPHLADLGPPFGIDHGEHATAVPDNQVSGARIEPDVVGVLTEPHHANRREILPAEELHGTVASAGDGDEVRRRRVADALGLAQPGDAPDLPAGGEVDDIEGAVAELGDEQPPAGEVDRHVVDPPHDARKCDPALDHHGGLALRRRGETDQRESESEERGSPCRHDAVSAFWC